MDEKLLDDEHFETKTAYSAS